MRLERMVLGLGGARAAARLGSVAAGALPWVLLAACSATKEAQLAEVAKDWNKVVRASQVIPIYPLSQDLQPGDLFLVQTTIQEQQALWERGDYLPLDYHLARLQPAGYADFYDKSFFGGERAPVLPKDWLAGKAPSAAFPSYSFSVKRGGGLNLAVPVSGVPVGLSLLGADAAEGTLALGSARTFGIDIASLQRQVEGWALANRELLAAFAPQADEDPHSYVRVVGRVYLVGSIDISLRSADQAGAGLDAGAPKPVELLTLDPARAPSAATADHYAQGIEALNGMLEKARSTAEGASVLLPGGSLKVTAASARSIAMQESFDPPLVVGYLGFDLPILRGGFVGRPIPTQAMLSGAAPAVAVESVAGDPVGAIHEQALGMAAWELLRSRTGDERAQGIVAAMDDLAVRLFDDEPAQFFAFDPDERRVVARPRKIVAAGGEFFNYRSFRRYLGELEISIQNLEQALGALPIELVDASGARTQVLRGSDELAELASELERERAQRARLLESDRAQLRTAVAHLDTLLNPRPARRSRR